MTTQNKAMLGGLLVLAAMIGVFVVFGERPAGTVAPGADQAAAITPDKSRSRRIENPSREFLNLASNVTYVGDAACVNCHFNEANGFHAHPMGNSVREVRDVPLKPLAEPFVAGNYRYSIRKDDKNETFHVEEKLDADGKVIQRREEPVKLAIGSGKRGHSFAFGKDGALFQSPVSWYGMTGKYQLSPGYDERNLHWEYPVTQACLHCHTDRAETKPDGSVSLGALRISCERCHGPGSLHVENPEMKDGYDKTIVNPVKLDPHRRDQVCYQCHLPLNMREVKPGKSLVEYRPGSDLEDFIERTRGVFADPFSNLSASGYVRAIEDSKCYQQSDGRLGCTTCHNPHVWPEKAEERHALQIKNCKSCHETEKTCSMQPEARLKKSPSNDCLACHMPNRNTTDIGHNALTDHRIPRVGGLVAPETHAKSPVP